MASFLALYTKNTTKKAKTWLDGTITATPAGTNRMSVVLKTEHGVEIETDFVKLCVEGEELKLERHLVQVLEPKGPAQGSVPPALTTVPKSAPPLSRRMPMVRPAERPALSACDTNRQSYGQPQGNVQQGGQQQGCGKA